MKIHSKHTHRSNIPHSGSKEFRSISGKQVFKLHESHTVSKEEVFLDKVKDRVQKEGIKGSEGIGRIITEEMLKGMLKIKLNKKEFQALMDRVYGTIKEDPDLSVYIKKLASKLE